MPPRPAMSTSRRFPYSSYLPFHTNSVLSVESGCGLFAPYRPAAVLSFLFAFLLAMVGFSRLLEPLVDGGEE